MRKIKTAVLISGRGSNMVSLVKASQHQDYPANISLVISNIPNAPGLAKARDLGIMAMTVSHKDFPNRKKFETALHAVLKQADIELICCAGFMRVLTPWFVEKWDQRLLNIHPSLLPKYKGLNTHIRALDAGDKYHGCTVHFVTSELDGGETIMQKSIEIELGDTAGSLATRLLLHELSLYPKALAKIASQLINETLN